MIEMLFPTNRPENVIYATPIIYMKSMILPKIDQILVIDCERLDDGVTFNFVSGVLSDVLTAFSKEELPKNYFLMLPVPSEKDTRGKYTYNDAEYTLFGMAGRLADLQDLQPEEAERIVRDRNVKDINIDPDEALVFLGFLIRTRDKEKGVTLEPIIDPAISLIGKYILPLYKEHKLASSELPIHASKTFFHLSTKMNDSSFSLAGKHSTEDVYKLFAEIDSSIKGRSCISNVYSQDSYRLLNKSNLFKFIINLRPIKEKPEKITPLPVKPLIYMKTLAGPSVDRIIAIDSVLAGIIPGIRKRLQIAANAFSLEQADNPKPIYRIILPIACSLKEDDIYTLFGIMVRLNTVDTFMKAYNAVEQPISGTVEVNIQPEDTIIFLGYTFRKGEKAKDTYPRDYLSIDMYKRLVVYTDEILSKILHAKEGVEKPCFIEEDLYLDSVKYVSKEGADHLVKAGYFEDLVWPKRTGYLDLVRNEESLHLLNNYPITFDYVESSIPKSKEVPDPIPDYSKTPQKIGEVETIDLKMELSKDEMVSLKEMLQEWEASKDLSNVSDEDDVVDEEPDDEDYEENEYEGEYDEDIDEDVNGEWLKYINSNLVLNNHEFKALISHLKIKLESMDRSLNWIAEFTTFLLVAVIVIMITLLIFIL